MPIESVGNSTNHCPYFLLMIGLEKLFLKRPPHCIFLSGSVCSCVMKKALLSSIAALLTPAFLIANKLIPREKLFQLPSCMAIKISPEGKRLAYVGADDHGIMNLFCSPQFIFRIWAKIHPFQRAEDQNLSLVAKGR